MSVPRQRDGGFKSSLLPQIEHSNRHDNIVFKPKINGNGQLRSEEMIEFYRK